MTPDRLDQIQALYLAALEQPPAERAAFVADAAAGDAALHDEVASLLAVEAGTFLDAPLADVRGVAEAAVPPPSLPPGTSFGAYRLLEEIGRGGMGTVYLAARSDGHYERRVALKVIRRDAGSDDVVRRFLQERQILARLAHPHVARLYDGGVGPGGQPYLVMEYVEGEPITAYCDRRRLSVAERLRLFLQAVAAVHYAHQNLVVHRDLKPSNILVTEGGGPGGGQVKLLDFGIAKLLEEEAGAALTRTGLRLLTPEYAAPEQVRGAPVTTATDVYALGVLLYELLTGHHPLFETRPAPALLEQAILDAEPLRPSTAAGRARPAPGGPPRTPQALSHARATDPAALRRRLAGDLDTIVLKALRKEPERRYASAEALADDVRRHLDGLPVEARPDTPGYRAGKFVRRHRVGVAGSALALLVLVAFGVFYTVRVAAERNRAEAAAAQARLEAGKAAAVKDFLVGVFRVSDPDASRGATVTAQELLDAGAARIGAELSGQPLVQAEMMAVLGEVYQQLGLYDQADTLLAAALRLERRHARPDSGGVAAALGRLALLRYHQGDFEAAIGLLRRALALHEARPTPDAAALAATRTHLATLLLESGAPEPADSLLRLALPARRTLGRPLDLAETLNARALLLAEQGRYDEAEPLYREALALQGAALDADHPDLAETRYNLAQLLWSRGDLAAAEPIFRQVLATSRRVYGPDHPEVALDLNSLALVLMDRGAFAEAEVLYREALALQARLLGEAHPDYTATLYNLGTVHYLTERYAEAERLLRRALALDRRLFEPGHPNLAIDQTRLAAVLRARGAHAEASALLHDALATFSTLYPDDHHRLASARIRLGQIAFDQGRPAEAAALLRQGLGSSDASFTTSWKTAEAQSALGQALLALGRPAEALPLLSAAAATLDALFPPSHTLRRQTTQALATARRAGR